MLKKITAKFFISSPNKTHTFLLSSDEFIWGLGSLCALNRIAFDPKLVLNQFPLPHTNDSFIRAIQHIGFKSKQVSCTPHKLQNLSFPCFAFVNPKNPEDASGASMVLLSDASSEYIIMFDPGTNTVIKLSLLEFSFRYLGLVVLTAKSRKRLKLTNLLGSGI